MPNVPRKAARSKGNISIPICSLIFFAITCPLLFPRLIHYPQYKEKRASISCSSYRHTSNFNSSPSFKMASSGTLWCASSNLTSQDVDLSTADIENCHTPNWLINDPLSSSVSTTESSLSNRQDLSYISPANYVSSCLIQQSNEQSLESPPPIDAAFTDSDQYIEPFFVDPFPLPMCPSGEPLGVDELPVCPVIPSRRSFVETMAAHDMRSVSMQEKRRDASIDYLLQTLPNDQSEYQIENSPEAARHTSGPSRPDCIPMHDESQGVTNFSFQAGSTGEEYGYVKASESCPDMPFAIDSTARPHAGNVHNTASKSSTRKKFDLGSIESAWTSDFKPFKAPTPRPKTRAQKIASNTLRRNGGACPKHRLSKRKVSISV